jgi:hypothetical protein
VGGRRGSGRETGEELTRSPTDHPLRRAKSRSRRFFISSSTAPHSCQRFPSLGIIDCEPRPIAKNTHSFLCPCRKCLTWFNFTLALTLLITRALHYARLMISIMISIDESILAVIICILSPSLLIERSN